VRFLRKYGKKALEIQVEIKKSFKNAAEYVGNLRFFGREA